MNLPAFDPFSADPPDGEHTVFAMPRPGGPRAPRGPARHAPIEDLGEPPPEGLPSGVGLNPLLAAAHPLLMLAPRIRATARLADPLALKESLAQGLREFEARARAAGVPAERALAARYILCTLLDEAAGSTPWGGSGQWVRQNLLVAFHNENAGGAKVFELMARLADDPAPNRDLLELIYAALCLGFEGRFGTVEGGRAQVDAVRERLAGILRRVRPAHAPELAQHWQVRPVRRRPLLSWLPLCASAAVVALLLTAVYASLSFTLSARAEPLYARIQALQLPGAAAVTPRPAAAPRLAQLLQPELQRGLLDLREQLDRSTVTLRGDTMFEPGSASVSPRHSELLQRLAQALVQVGGDVLVTGHTDDRPIRSLRFPSNWQLSQARADAVRGLLIGAGVPAAGVRAEGRGAGEPLVANDTPEQRARNRRIEVVVFVAARPERQP